jgi:2'-hydroxyisoflavone reductase
MRLNVSISRRRFLEATALGAGALGLPGAGWALNDPRPTEPLSLLVLGGTGFIGPHIVQNALDRGHSVTLFNRGRSNTHLFPQVEKLVGDRGGQLDALRGRSWDAVIDNSGYFVSHVRQSAELLRDSVEPAGAPENPSDYYGPIKAECEDVIVETYPGRGTRVRPGWIAGPGDNNHLLTYWVMLLVRGGEMMAPGEPSDPMQITDVRDLAKWYIHILENRILGAYNAVGPVITMGSMLESIRDELSADVSFTWVDKDFMFERDAKPWIQIPIWWPPINDWGEKSGGGNYGGVGALALDGSAAWAQGMEQTPLRTTARDTYEWFSAEMGEWPPQRRAPGLTAELEERILREWRAR